MHFLTPKSTLLSICLRLEALHRRLLLILMLCSAHSLGLNEITGIVSDIDTFITKEYHWRSFRKTTFIKMFRPWRNVFCGTSGTICIRLIMTEHPHLGCCSRIANDYLYWGRERERERALHAHLPCSAQTGNNRQDSHMIMPKQACFHYILCSGAVVCHLFRGFRVRTWILLSLLWGLIYVLRPYIEPAIIMAISFKILLAKGK